MSEAEEREMKERVAEQLALGERLEARVAPAAARMVRSWHVTAACAAVVGVAAIVGLLLPAVRNSAGDWSRGILTALCPVILYVPAAIALARSSRRACATMVEAVAAVASRQGAGVVDGYATLVEVGMLRVLLGERGPDVLALAHVMNGPAFAASTTWLLAGPEKFSTRVVALHGACTRAMERKCDLMAFVRYITEHETSPTQVGTLSEQFPPRT